MSRFVASACALAFLFPCLGASLPSPRSGVSIVEPSVDETTVVRFFYQPSGDYFHFPLVFRVAAPGSPDLNSAPMRQEGRTPFISLDEMSALIQKLERARLVQQQSESAATIESFRNIPASDDMRILVVSPAHSARGAISPKKICKTLAPLDSAFRTPRALWEFRGFRLNYGCAVSGFNPDAYPDH